MYIHVSVAACGTAVYIEPYKHKQIFSLKLLWNDNEKIRFMKSVVPSDSEMPNLRVLISYIPVMRLGVFNYLPI